MPRTDTEVKSVVEEIKKGFADLKTKAEQKQDQLYRHQAYLEALTKGFPDRIKKTIEITSPAPRTATWQLEGIINQSLTFHVEGLPGASERTKAAQRADRKELFWGNTWHVKFDFVGTISPDTRRWQAAGPVATWWVDHVGYALPKEEKDRQKYRESYFPAKLRVVSPFTAFWLEDDKGDPTMAVLEYELPYIEIVKRYASDDYDGENGLEICRERFPHLRGGHANAVDLTEQDLTNKKAKVCVIDDGVTICHYTDIGEDGREGRYKEVGEYPNPWGMPSLVVIPGMYNPDAIELCDRYLGLNDMILDAQFNLDVQDSLVLSIAATPPKPTESLPENVALALLDGQQLPEGDAGDAIRLFGLAGEWAYPVDPALLQVRQDLMRERDNAMPAPYLTNPDQQIAAYSNTAVALQANETSNRAYDNARLYMIRAIRRVSKMIEHCICNDSYLKDEEIHYRVRGDEPTKLFAGKYKNQLMSVSAEDFEVEDVLMVEKTADSQAQKLMAFQTKDAQYAKGYITKRMVLEEITEDVTSLVEELEEEAIVQQQGPMFDRAAALVAINTVKADSALPGIPGSGIDLSPLMMPIIFPGDPNDPTAAQNGNGGSPPREPNSLITQTSAAPITNATDIGVPG